MKWTLSALCALLFGTAVFGQCPCRPQAVAFAPAVVYYQPAPATYCPVQPAYYPPPAFPVRQFVGGAIQQFGVAVVNAGAAVGGPVPAYQPAFPTCPNGNCPNAVRPFQFGR